jgi:hypothetical protein
MKSTASGTGLPWLAWQFVRHIHNKFVASDAIVGRQLKMMVAQYRGYKGLTRCGKAFYCNPLFLPSEAFCGATIRLT